MFIHPDDDHPVATEAEAHAEWHAVTGLRFGCPQDACWAPEPPPVEERCSDPAPHGSHDVAFDVWCPGQTPFPTLQWSFEIGPDDPRDLPF